MGILTVAALAGCSGASSAGGTAATEPIAADTTVAFVGDSIVHGQGLPEGTAWPDLVGADLGWDAINLGCNGGGFIAPGSCDTPLGERAADVAASDPSVIVVAPSRNDLGYPVTDVVDAIAPAVTALASAAPQALIVGVSAVWGPTERPSDLDSYNTALAAAVLAIGGRFLSFQDPLRDAADQFLADGIHPTEQGQRLIATAFERAAVQAGLVSGPPAVGSTTTSTPATAPATPSPTTSPPRASGPIATGSRVVFVGDSIVHGFGVDAVQAWPALVSATFGWNGVNLGCDGGGFISPGACSTAIGDRAAEIAALDPDVIVISASRNDLSVPVEQVVATIPIATAEIAAASPRARIIGVSSVWGPTERPADLNRYDAAVAEAANATDGIFLAYADPLSSPADLILADLVHPNAAGQAAIAASVETAATAAGLTP